MLASAARPLLLAGLLASALALGLTRVEDTDAWTHLALGREIVQARALPQAEPFTYASGGAPYRFLEWLFDVVLYLAYAAGGFAGVVLLKATVIALVVAILWMDSALPRGGSPSSALDPLVRAAVLLPVLFLLIRHRIVERPDLVLMLFLAFTIYALDAYLYAGRRLLYALPLVHAVWANMHPSLAVSVVPYLAVLAAGLGPRLLGRRRGAGAPAHPSPRQLRTVGAVGALGLGASLLNPYGVLAFTSPLEVFGSWWHTTHILELQPVLPWLAPGPYLLALAVAGSFVLVRRPELLHHALLVAPFVYLGLSRLRFVAIMAVVAAPVLARNLRLATSTLRRGWFRRAVAVTAAGAVLATLVGVGLATGTRIEPFAQARKRPGFGANTLFLPEKALAYLDRNGVTGRLFNPFGWGGYIAWRDFPRRQPIVDGRGHAPEDLLAEIDFAPGQPDVLERLQKRYGFDVAVVQYPWVRGGAHAATGFIDPARWALVYWDDVALVYAKRSSRLARLVERDEYRVLRPALGIPALREALADPAIRPAILAEAQRNVRETGSAIGHTILGFAYLETGDLDRAVAAFSRVEGYATVRDAQQGLAMAAWKKGDLATAIAIYSALLRAGDDPLLRFNLGLALATLGRDREAVAHLERVRASLPELAALYPVLTDVYRRLGRPEREAELRAAHARALEIARVAEHARNALRLQAAGRPAEAAAELEAALRLDGRDPAIRTALGNLYATLGRPEDALVQYRTVLQRHPDFPEAHYRLALLARERGDGATARRHLTAFLSLEHRGYRAWEARKALAQLGP